MLLQLTFKNTKIKEMYNFFYLMRKLILILLLLAYSDSNSQWVKVTYGMGEGRDVRSMVAHGNFVFAGTINYGLYISFNYGDFWSNLLSQSEVYSLASNGSSIFAGLSTGVLKSTNGGLNWFGTGLTRSTYSLTTTNDYVFAGTYAFPHVGNPPAGVYISSNNGASWMQSSLNNQNIYAMASNDQYIYAGAGYYSTLNPGLGVYVSADFGLTWTQTLFNYHIYALAVNGIYVFAGTGSGVFVSTNGGYNWVSSLENYSIRSLYKYGNYIFAGTSSNGVFISSNNGSNWVAINEGIENLGVRALTVKDNYVFAGTGGVYRRPLDELVNVNQISQEIPGNYQLFQNYPNPFNPVTKIKFHIPRQTYTKLVVYDNLGREISILVNEYLIAGTYEAKFDGEQLSGGVYFYKLQTEEYTKVFKMILTK